MSDLDTLRLKVDVQRRLIAMLSRRRTEQTVTAAHLLAHQQARGIEAQEPEGREVMLEGAGPGATRDGDPAFSLRLLPPEDVVLHIAEAMLAMLDEAQAQNYIEMQIQHRTRGVFVLCIQRASGLSPHRLRLQAESERDEARDENERLRGVLRDVAHCGLGFDLFDVDLADRIRAALGEEVTP